MCSINHDLKAIFIHNPKTGGSYISKILDDFYNFRHISFVPDKNNPKLNKPQYFQEEDSLIKINGIINFKIGSSEFLDLTDMTHEQLNSYYKFTFIRNPYDKIVSAFKFISNGYSSICTFQEFIYKKQNCKNNIFVHSFINQYDFLLDHNNKLDINFLGDFNNLNEELINVLKKLGVKEITHGKLITENIKINHSLNTSYYYKYFNEETLKVVNMYFKNDFDKFHFKQCHTLEELEKECIIYYNVKKQNEERIKLLYNSVEEDNLVNTEKISHFKSCSQMSENDSYYIFINNLYNIDRKNNLDIGYSYNNIFLNCVEQLENSPNIKIINYGN